MKNTQCFSAGVLIAGLVLASGCGSAETKVPTAVSTDEQRQLEASQQNAADAEMQHRQANPH